MLLDLLFSWFLARRCRSSLSLSVEPILSSTQNTTDGFLGSHTSLCSSLIESTHLDREGLVDTETLLINVAVARPFLPPRIGADEHRR